MMMMGGMAAIWLVVLIVLAVRAAGPLLAGAGWTSALPPRRQRTPEELVRDRYARGELGWPEYQEVLVSLLKDRYVRGELELSQYEERVSRLLDESVPEHKAAVARRQPDSTDEGSSTMAQLSE